MVKIVVHKLFGPNVVHYLPLIESLTKSLPGTEYRIQPTERYIETLKADTREALSTYWKEILARAHEASALSILRNYGWVRGVIDSCRQQNFLAFCACLRGFLESTADTFDALWPVSSVLASHRTYISDAVLKKPISEFRQADKLEDTLIHFTFARRLGKTHTAPSSHGAKTTQKYLDILQKANVHRVRDCYSELCEFTHPAARSVIFFLESNDGCDAKLVAEIDAKVIVDFLEKYPDTMADLLTAAFNPAILILAVLNYFPLKEYHCKEIKDWPVEGIPGWSKIKKHLPVE